MNSEGKKYVEQKQDELDKNHRPTTGNDMAVTEGRMYENSGEMDLIRPSKMSVGGNPSCCNLEALVNLKKT